MTQMGSTTPVDQTMMPAAVRNGTDERKAQYQQAQQFERILVGQMTEQLMKSSSSLSGEDSAAVKAMKENMPSVLADALVGSGGLGIAAQLDSTWAAATATSLSDTAAANAKSASGAAAAGAPTGDAAAASTATATIGEGSTTA